MGLIRSLGSPVKFQRVRSRTLCLLGCSLALLFTSMMAFGEGTMPNILVIFGDDIGQTNISRYSHGLVGYMTPNIDRVGEEGITSTDYYAENSCTAGRSSFGVSNSGDTLPSMRYMRLRALLPLLIPSRRAALSAGDRFWHRHYDWSAAALSAPGKACMRGASARCGERGRYVS